MKNQAGATSNTSSSSGSTLEQTKKLLLEIEKKINTLKQLTEHLKS